MRTQEELYASKGFFESLDDEKHRLFPLKHHMLDMIREVMGHQEVAARWEEKSIVLAKEKRALEEKVAELSERLQLHEPEAVGG